MQHMELDRQKMTTNKKMVLCHLISKVQKPNYIPVQIIYLPFEFPNYHKKQLMTFDARLHFILLLL